MFKKLITIMIAGVFLAGCESLGGKKQTTGTILGAASGAYVGSRFGKGSGQLVATAIGTLIGAQIGSAIGKNMDDNDRRMAGNTAVNALENQPDNRVSTWRNPNNDHRGEFVVTRTSENRSTNVVCRDYTHTVVIDGQKEKVYGRACRDMRDSRGSWYLN